MHQLKFRHPKTWAILFFFSVLLTAVWAADPPASGAPANGSDVPETLHPALFLVGDSIMKTGKPPGDTGQWGMGSELALMFDPEKIHVYNLGAGGRSSRSYIGEGLWARVLERMQPGDYVLVMFGHNDARNSKGYVTRSTITGSGDETIEVDAGDDRKTVHTYGWYLRQYALDAKAKGATVIICSPVPRNLWTEGRIVRGFNGYAQWAAEAAQASGAFFIDLNTLASNCYDALGQEATKAYFNDPQHTKKAGARVNAQCVVEGLNQPEARCPLQAYLLPAQLQTN